MGWHHLGRGRRVKARTASTVVLGVDLQRLVKRWSRSKSLDKRLAEYTVTVAHRKRRPSGYLAWVHYGERRIHVITWPGLTLGEILTTLLHECCHASGCADPGGHTMAFAEIECRAAEELWGIEPWCQLSGRGAWRNVEKLITSCLWCLGPEYLQEIPERL